LKLIQLLVLFAIGWLTWHFIRQHREAKRLRRRRTPRSVERMVKCVACGTHVPKAEAECREGRCLCSECREAERG